MDGKLGDSQIKSLIAADASRLLARLVTAAANIPDKRPLPREARHFSPTLEPYAALIRTFSLHVSRAVEPCNQDPSNPPHFRAPR